MKRFAFMAVLAVSVVAAVHGASPAGREKCLQSGDAWFGELGCETMTPVIDRIVIDKSDRLLIAYEGGREVRRFRVALGRQPLGHKQRQGDNRTPEGVYPVTAHNPESAFHLSLRLGYPTAEQVAAAEAAGVDPGGDIMIHGLPNGMGRIGRAHRKRDWTQGCVALTNDEIEWLYRFTPVGAVVDIRA